MDFRLPDSSYLFISIEPADPRIYLIKRRLRGLERSSGNLSPFFLYLRKHLSGAEITSIERIPNERALVFELRTETELEGTKTFKLAVQLTGRSANLFLLDHDGRILESARDTLGEGQQVGDVFRPPEREGDTKRNRVDEMPSICDFETLSEALDRRHQEKEAERKFRSLAGGAGAKVKQEIAKRARLITRLNEDLANHGDAGKWKRLGDLLLANVATAERKDDVVIVTDYFDENTPQIEIDIEKEESITEAAERFFRRYTKARNAGEEIVRRLETLDKELKDLYLQRERVEDAITAKDEEFLAAFLGRVVEERGEKGKPKPPDSNAGVRSFTSSDGFEILVGKKAKDNDFLTFRLAKSLDLWMHAADYPGSHVVVRNPDRKEIPQRTLLEAAQLAAFFSQAKKHPKAAVNYTQKKFVNKPRGAALGLVSISSFKTILVEPKVPQFDSLVQNHLR